ncbi:hypothetical protein EXIGLDRAFT_782169 [Exidia glandulosa HHB12029]|uniref:Uncharacterized protein n=1 Tax=Exidia glandulosa HHB12029 TaxID=1314781 RepID=A0A165AY59_EXIGL|nr:hypothetical protein EXIGLDRAFT_782169 [Exidia glandulosa HHB12029]
MGRRVQFESDPGSGDEAVESPTKRKSKEKQAAKKAASAAKKNAPDPPADPPAVIPRAKTNAQPTARELRANKRARASSPTAPAPPVPRPLLPRISTKSKTAAKPTNSRILAPRQHSVRQPSTPKRGARVRKPAARSPAKARQALAAKKARAPAKKPKATVAKKPGRAGSRKMPADDDDADVDPLDDEWEGVEDDVDDDDAMGEDDVDMDDGEGDHHVDDDDGYVSPTDDMLAGQRRSNRYSRPLGDSFEDDEEEQTFIQPTRGLKRSHPLRSSVASVTDVVSPARKKQQAPADWGRFVKGRTVDPQLALIPECVKAIVNGGFVQYLPVHLFAPEILVAEASARLTMRADESILTRMPQPRVAETDMTLQDYMMWSRKAILAYRALGVPEDIVEMWEEHFKSVLDAENVASEWTTWRYYDLRRRALVMGSTPADISKFDATTFRQCQNLVLSEMNAEMRAATERANQLGRRTNQAQASTSRSQNATSQGPSTSKAASKASSTSKYSRCLSCGSRAHVYDKDKRRDDCETTWLVYDKTRGAWRTPDTRALVCWAWNSIDGCSKDKCRFGRHGHRCSLCGGDHGCHACTV